MVDGGAARGRRRCSGEPEGRRGSSYAVRLELPFTPGAADLAARAAVLADRLVDGLKPLADVAYNYRWSWAQDGAALFSDINGYRWSASGQNPVRFLEYLWPATQAKAQRDGEILRRIDALARMVAADVGRPDRVRPGVDGPIVFFSAEFGLHVSLPIYAGGLGVLAGDFLKEASDQGLPMIAIGLFYNRGYFRQRIDTTGRQHEYWLTNDSHGLPMGRVTDPDGTPLRLSVELFGSSMLFQVWRVDVGRVPLFLLDSDLPQNDPVQRWTTARLYDGTRAVRLAQYGLLGIGGARLLRALGVEPAVVHLNEGHAALAPLELAASEVAAGASLDEALARIRDRVVFTTHTPVAAGNETYAEDEFLAAFGELPARLGIGNSQFLDLCRIQAGTGGGQPGMTPLALRMSRQRNGVSRLHGEVARRMWQPLFGTTEAIDVPITHVTNGAHLATFTSAPLRRLYERHVGKDWLRLPADPASWEAVLAIPNAELWAARQEARSALVEYVRAKSQQDRLQRGEQIDYVRAVADALRPDALTLGFARRVATYKRLHLLLHDPGRLRRLLTGAAPVQLLIAGKAHPNDADGKETLQRVYRLKRDWDDVAERMIFLEDYDLDVSRQLVGGCDVWVNLPRKPMEASGTSGMKAAFNGVLQLSVLDGWWAEAYDGSNGWAIQGEEDGDEPTTDARDANRFYDLLEQEVIPLFDDRDARGVPHRWCERVKQSIVTCAPAFNTTRMLDDYVERIYTSRR